MKLFFVLPEATIQSRKVSSIESSFHIFRIVVIEATAAVLSCIDLFAVAFTMLGVGECFGLGNLFLFLYMPFLLSVPYQFYLHTHSKTLFVIDKPVVKQRRTQEKNATVQTNKRLQSQ